MNDTGLTDFSGTAFHYLHHALGLGSFLSSKDLNNLVLLVELVCCGDGDCVGDEWTAAALRAYAGERTVIRPAHHLLHDFGWWH